MNISSITASNLIPVKASSASQNSGSADFNLSATANDYWTNVNQVSPTANQPAPAASGPDATAGDPASITSIGSHNPMHGHHKHHGPSFIAWDTSSSANSSDSGSSPTALSAGSMLDIEA